MAKEATTEVVACVTRSAKLLVRTRRSTTLKVGSEGRLRCSKVAEADRVGAGVLKGKGQTLLGAGWCVAMPLG